MVGGRTHAYTRVGVEVGWQKLQKLRRASGRIPAVRRLMGHRESREVCRGRDASLTTLGFNLQSSPLGSSHSCPLEKAEVPSTDQVQGLVGGGYLCSGRTPLLTISKRATMAAAAGGVGVVGGGVGVVGLFLGGWHVAQPPGGTGVVRHHLAVRVHHEDPPRSA